MTPLEAALAYAKRGWPVFPIAVDLKTPATKNGLYDATVDAAQLTKWWTARKGFADRNVAVVTSRRSGIWVLDCDVDTRTGETVGETTLADLEAKHGKMPAHPIATTPKGGKHHVFAYPDDGIDLPRRIKFAPGLDALGSRMEEDIERAGYFLVFPSRVQGGRYSWDVPPSAVKPAIPQAPRWLVDMVRASAPPPQVERTAPRPQPTDGTTPYGRKALDDICAEIAACPPGSQDDTLLRKSRRVGRMVGGGQIDEREAYAAMVDAGMRMVNGGKPWTHAEVEKKVRRGMAHGINEPLVPKPRERPETAEPAPQTATIDPPKPTERPKPQLIVSNPLKPAPQPPPDWMTGKRWITDNEGNLKPKEAINCQLMIEHHPELRGMFSYNSFTDRVMVNRPLPGYERDTFPRAVNDQDEAALWAWLNWHKISPSLATVGVFMREVAFRAAYDPLSDYLTSLKWDGKDRISNWLTYYAAAEDNEYTRMVGRKFLIGAAARALDPGCKVDTMLIAEGPQRLGKSTMPRALFGAEFFSDQIGDITSKDGAERIQGTWCVEIAEMDKFSRVEANAIKSFMSQRDDRYRAAYARNTVTRPRRCVFFGTINPDGVGYLKDSTGNTRFWPVAVKHIDLEGIAADRDQIWAEAVAAYRGKERWWLSAEEEEAFAAPEQDARRDDDVWEPRILDWLKSRDPTAPRIVFTSADCLVGIGVDAPRQGHREKIRVAKILKMFGCEPGNAVNGVPGRSWEYRRGK